MVGIDGMVLKVCGYLFFRAGRLYSSAVSLIEAVLITTADPEHRKKLDDYIKRLNEKYDVCKQRAEEVGEVW